MIARDVGSVSWRRELTGIFGAFQTLLFYELDRPLDRKLDRTRQPRKLVGTRRR